MAVAPVPYPPWLPGTWEDTCWEEGTWGGVAVPEQPTTPDLTRFPFLRWFASGGSMAEVRTRTAGAGAKLASGASEALVMTDVDGGGQKASARAGSVAVLHVVPQSVGRKQVGAGAEAVGAVITAEGGPGEAVDIESLCELLMEATLDGAGALGLTRLS